MKRKKKGSLESLKKRPTRSNPWRWNMPRQRRMSTRSWKYLNPIRCRCWRMLLCWIRCMNWIWPILKNYPCISWPERRNWKRREVPNWQNWWRRQSGPDCPKMPRLQKILTQCAIALKRNCMTLSWPVWSRFRQHRRSVLFRIMIHWWLKRFSLRL